MLTGAIELFLISLGLTYFMAATGAGLRVRLAAARPGPGRPGDRRQHGRHGRPRGRRAGSRPPVPERANGGQKTARLTEHAVPAGGTGPAGAHRGAGRLRPRLALAGGAHRMDAPWLTLAATGAHRGGADGAQPVRARLRPQVPGWGR